MILGHGRLLFPAAPLPESGEKLFGALVFRPVSAQVVDAVDRLHTLLPYQRLDLRRCPAWKTGVQWMSGLRLRFSIKLFFNDAEHHIGGVLPTAMSFLVQKLANLRGKIDCKGQWG